MNVCVCVRAFVCIHVQCAFVVCGMFVCSVHLCVWDAHVQCAFVRHAYTMCKNQACKHFTHRAIPQSLVPAVETVMRGGGSSACFNTTAPLTGVMLRAC